MILIYFAGFVISVLLLLIGLIKPSFVFRWGTQRTRARSSLMYGALTLAFLVGMVVTTPDSAEQAATPTTQKQANNTPEKSDEQSNELPKENVKEPTTTPKGKTVPFQLEESYYSQPTFYEGEVNDNGKPNGKGKITYTLLDKTYTLYEGEFKNGIYDGKGTLYKDDVIEFSGVFLNGEKVFYPYQDEFYYDKGVITFYGDQSKTKAGKTMKVYYTSGNLYYEGGCTNGKITGKGTIFYLSGKPKESGEFVNGELAGKGMKYYESGITQQEGQYEEGVLNGKGKLYHPTGKLEVQGHFQDSRLFGNAKVFDENGNLVLEGKFDDGRLEGDGMEYHENGKVKYRGDFKNSKYHGKGKLYNDSGEVIQEGKWDNGEFVAD